MSHRLGSLVTCARAQSCHRGEPGGRQWLCELPLSRTSHLPLPVGVVGVSTQAIRPVVFTLP